MAKTTKKDARRYVVTYADPQTDVSTVADILSMKSSDVQNGVDIMATEAMIQDSDVLHFHDFGSTSLTLSSDQADTLRGDNRVLAVEEDIEVFALDDDNEDLGFQDTMSAYRQTLGQYYEQGYKTGTADTVSKVLEAIRGLAPAAEAGTAIPFPILPPPVVIPPFLQQPVPWNINMVKAPRAWARGIRGNGVKVAIIDTGIANHPDLIVSGGASFVPGVVSFNDDNGHGTHCAGIVGARNNSIGVVGVAPSCSLYAVKVLSSAGSGQLSWILAGMAWARQNGMNVVSMSLGSNSGPIVAYTNAIAQLNAVGITVVCAAGNNGLGGSVGAPANSPGAIAVGAVDINRVIAPFSSRGGVGNQVTLVAPGVQINSTYPVNTYKVLSGTSMACPHVAGAVALVRQRFPVFNPAQIRQKLQATATDLGVPGNDPVYGAGLLDCDRATL